MVSGRTWLLIGSLAGLTACGDSGSGPSQDELVGTWRITKCEYVSTAGLGTVDLISEGATGTLVLTADDTLRLVVTPTVGAPVVLTATYVIDGIDLMRVTPAGASWYWAFDLELSGGRLRLTNGAAQYDFNDDGVLDEAKWNLEMAK